MSPRPGAARGRAGPMRSAMPLLIAGGSLALLPLLAPAAPMNAGGRERSVPCLLRQEGPVALSRDWMGSLKGWQESALVLAWRNALAAAKGKPPVAGCEPAGP